MPIVLKEGDPAPDFNLEISPGQYRSLKDFRGKSLVLYFYPKDDTSGCTLEAKDFSTLKADFEVLNVVILGVSPDNVQSHAKFQAKHNLTLDLGADEAQTVLKTYGVWVEKSMYGRTYMGVERTTFLINPQGIILRIWHKVKAKDHAGEVLATVKSL